MEYRDADDPRYVPLSVHDARVRYGQMFNVPRAPRTVVNLTGKPDVTVRTFGPKKSELIRTPRAAQRWYVAYVPYGKAHRYDAPRYSDPFKTRGAAQADALRRLNAREAFRAEVVKGE